MLPVMARNLLESIRLLANVSRLLADRCIDGIRPTRSAAASYAEGSPSIVTPLNRYLGYEEAASSPSRPSPSSKTIRQVVVERGHVDAGQAHAGGVCRDRARRAGADRPRVG